MKKHFLFFIIILALVVPGVALAHNNISVVIDGQQVNFDPAPVIENGTTLVPMRLFFEYLGAEVSWDAETRTAVGVRDGVEVRITIGSNKAVVNGVETEISLPARIVDGSTIIPLRFMAEEVFGAYVGWNSTKKEIKIETTGEPPEEEEGLELEVAFSLKGIASWYGYELAGRRTASGEVFNPYDFTAAHRDLPFGTMVKVTFLKTGKSIIVRINDRGPHIASRVIDLSMAAADAIGLKPHGIGDVLLEVFK